MNKQKAHITVQVALFFLNASKVHSLQKRKITSPREMSADLLEPHREMLESRVCWLGKS